MKNKLNKNCAHFLAKDKEDFQSSSFNSTKRLLEILPGLTSNQVFLLLDETLSYSIFFIN